MIREDYGGAGSYTAIGATGTFFNLPIYTTDLITQSPWVDSRAYATLPLAEAAAYAAGRELKVYGAYTLAANLTVRCAMSIEPGGSITTTGYTLTINGQFKGHDGCFAGSGSVVFGYPTVARPEYWTVNTNPGTTDMTTAMQAAINSLPEGGEFLLSPTDYLFSGATPLSITRRINFHGVSWNSRILVAASVGATIDVISVIPAVTGSGDYTGWKFKDFKIQSVSGTPARYGINFGYGSSTGLNRLTVEHVSITDLGSYSILSNGAGPVTIQDNALRSISFNAGADNINILNNTINSTNANTYGMYVNCVSGSNMLNIKQNVIVGAGTKNLVFINNAGTLTIADNQFEAQGTITGTITNPVTGGTYNTLLHIEGADRQMYNPIIIGNNFNGEGPSIRNVVQAHFDKNMIGGQVWIGASAIGTEIGNNFGSSVNTGAPGYMGFYTSSRLYTHVYDATYFPAGQIHDAGIGTVGVWKLLTLWTDCTRDTNYNDLAVIKETDNTVRINGGFSVANPTEAKVLSSLPAGFLPSAGLELIPAIAYTTVPSWVPIVVKIDYGGGIYLQAIPAGITITKVIINASYKHEYQ